MTTWKTEPMLIERLVNSVEKRAWQQDIPAMGEVYARLDGGYSARMLHADLHGQWGPLGLQILSVLVREAAHSLGGLLVVHHRDPLNVSECCFRVIE